MIPELTPIERPFPSNDQLTTTELLVYEFIRDSIVVDGFCPTDSQIASFLSQSKSVAGRFIAGLVRKGWLQRTEKLGRPGYRLARHTHEVLDYADQIRLEMENGNSIG